jgi:hypothetical protein
MPTVINDLTVEPKGDQPKADAKSDAGGGGAKGGPELERELAKAQRRQHDRVLRMWAH